MSWRTILVQSKSHLSVARGQLRLDLGDDDPATLPLADIAALILESPQITLTSALLSACAENGIAVLTTNETHTPNGTLLPFLPHSRHSKVAHTQQTWTEGLRKKLWQRIVRCKIMGQAYVLENIGSPIATRLTAMAARVQAGDPENIEAQAARSYWPALYGPDFRRHAGDTVNAALNYGYAILRASVARAQVAYGLVPAFGIHHNNDLNAFNLSDDMVEVLRPMVDEKVYNMRESLLGATTLTPEHRKELVALIGETLTMGTESVSVLRVCDALAMGLVATITEKDPTFLLLPNWEQRNGGR